MKISPIYSNLYVNTAQNKQTSGLTNPDTNVSFKRNIHTLGENQTAFSPIKTTSYIGKKNSKASEVAANTVFLDDGASINNLTVKTHFFFDYSQPDEIDKEYTDSTIVLKNNAKINKVTKDKSQEGTILNFYCETAVPEIKSIDLDKFCTFYTIKNNMNIHKKIKAGSVSIQDNAFVEQVDAHWVKLTKNGKANEIKGRNCVELFDNAFADRIDCHDVKIQGKASVNTINATSYLSLNDSAFAKKVQSEYIKFSENSRAEKIKTKNARIYNSSQVDNIEADNVTLENDAKAKEITAKSVELNNQAKVNNIKTKNNATLRGKSQAEFITSDNEISLMDEASSKKLTAKKITLSDKARAENITVENSLTMGNNCEVGNITVTGNKPEIILEGNAKITGKIIFENTRGTVYLKRNSDKSLPQIDESQVVNGSIEKLGPKIGFDKVAGMEELKQQLREDVIEPMEKPELYAKYGLQPINGILMYGPPGCGKTYIANALAEETGRHFVEIKMSNIGSSYQNATVNNLKEKFDEAIANAPSIILLDEVETLAPEREYIPREHPEVAERVTELLTQLNNCANKNIFVICASNEPQKVDKAVRRTGRMDKRIYVGPPDEKSRQEMFKMHLKDRYINNDINYKLISEKTSNYITSDIKALVDQAARYALRTNVPISTQHVLQAIETTKPSLTKNIIEYYKNKIED